MVDMKDFDRDILAILSGIANDKIDYFQSLLEEGRQLQEKTKGDSKLTLQQEFPKFLEKIKNMQFDCLEEGQELELASLYSQGFTVDDLKMVYFFDIPCFEDILKKSLDKQNYFIKKVVSMDSLKDKISQVKPEVTPVVRVLDASDIPEKAIKKFITISKDNILPDKIITSDNPKIKEIKIRPQTKCTLEILEWMYSYIADKISKDIPFNSVEIRDKIVKKFNLKVDRSVVYDWMISKLIWTEEESAKIKKLIRNKKGYKEKKGDMKFSKDVVNLPLTIKDVLTENSLRNIRKGSIPEKVLVGLYLIVLDLIRKNIPFSSTQLIELIQKEFNFKISQHGLLYRLNSSLNFTKEQKISISRLMSKNRLNNIKRKYTSPVKNKGVKLESVKKDPIPLKETPFFSNSCDSLKEAYLDLANQVEGKASPVTEGEDKSISSVVVEKVEVPLPNKIEKEKPLLGKVFDLIKLIVTK